MDEIRASVRRKMIVALLLSIVFMAGAGFLGRMAALDGHSFWEHRTLKKSVSALESKTEEFRPAMEEAKRMGTMMSSIKYEGASGLREILYRELSNIKLTVSEINVTSSKKQGLIDVSVTGTVGAEDLGAFLRGFSSRPKIWGAVEMSMAPAVAPAALVSQYVLLHRRGDKRGVDSFLAQERMLLGADGNAALLFNVTLKFTVVAG